MPQCRQRNSRDDTRGYISNESPDISGLKHLETLIGKGREGGEPAAKTDRQQQAPIAAGGGESGEQSIQEADEKTAYEIDSQCVPRK